MIENFLDLFGDRFGIPCQQFGGAMCHAFDGLAIEMPAPRVSSARVQDATQITRVFIRGRDVGLRNKHLDLYERFSSRPTARK